jgi:hypothetical protein
MPYRASDTRSTDDHRTQRPPTHLEPELIGQTVIVIGGSSDIGLARHQRQIAAASAVALTSAYSRPT